MPTDPRDGAATPILDQQAIAGTPVVVRRYVKWGDADSAGVVYTPRFLDYMIEAAEVWFKIVVGEHWAEFGRKRGISMPAVECSLDFHRAARPDDRLDIAVRVERIGRSSHTISVKCHGRDGVHVFDGVVTFATIDPAAEKSVAMPKELAARLDAYRRACGEP